MNVTYLSKVEKVKLTSNSITITKPIERILFGTIKRLLKVTIICVNE